MDTATRIQQLIKAAEANLQHRIAIKSVVDFQGCATDGNFTIYVEEVSIGNGRRSIRAAHQRLGFYVQIDGKWKRVKRDRFTAMMNLEQAASAEPAYGTHEAECNCDTCGELIYDNAAAY